MDFYKGTSCFILDDTTAEKTTKRGERVSRVFDHVLSKCVLGYKVQILCVSDGTTTVPVDFSIHREKGGDGSCGLAAGELRKQFRKKREKGSPSMERLREADRSKLDVAVEMIGRACKLRIRPSYVLADSWYLSEKLLHGIIDIGKGYRTNHVMAEYNYLLASSRQIIIDDDLDQEEAWNYGVSAAFSIRIGERKLELSTEYYYTTFLHQLLIDMDSNPHAVHFTNLVGDSYSHTWHLEDKTVTIEYDADKTTVSAIIEGFKKIRYEAKEVKTEKPNEQ